MSKHTVLYWNRATLEVYAVLREETPPGLPVLLLETDYLILTRSGLAAGPDCS